MNPFEHLRYTGKYAFAWGGPCGVATLRASDADFRVREELGYLPDGEGEHIWLQIEKTGTNTDWLAGKLAAYARIPRRDVGFAGLKDRRGITTQWFSLDMSGRQEPDWQGLELACEGKVRILDQRRHRRKLKRGQLRGNQFEITLRDCQLDEACLRQRLESIEHGGVPNYFGAQRFGHNGENVIKAMALLKDKRILRDRNKRSIYISALRAFLFNATLDERMRQANWNCLIDGDVLMLDGSNSYFAPEKNAEDIVQRLDQLDIHPSGPLYGEGEPPVVGDTAKIEQNVFSEYAEVLAVLDKIRNLSQERRSLRMNVRQLEYEYENTQLKLAFTLSRGCYATSVIRELVELREN